LKKIITNNCNFKFLNDETKVTLQGVGEFGGEVGVNKG